MNSRYDAIIVGARAAGAATAMLLARRGARVLVVDRSRYGSDTLSTHALMRPAVVQLKRWGLLDRVIASGAPAIRRATFHYPDESVAVELKPADGTDALFAPRRTILDRILVDAAVVAGAEVRFNVAVDGLLRDEAGRVDGIATHDDRGHRASHRAKIVIGADGIRSVVAQAAGATVTREARAGGAVVFGYFRGLQADGYEWAYAPGLAAGLIPTNDGEVCVFAGGPVPVFRREVQPDLGQGLHSMLAKVSPAMANAVSRAEPSGRFRGFAGVRGYYRKPWGEGWALVGDAGYFRDPITTHGITDAFRDAELLANAISGASTFAEYERLRDGVTRELFEVTGRIAAYDWTMDEVRVHLRDMSRGMRAESELIARFDAVETAAALNAPLLQPRADRECRVPAGSTR